MRITRGMSKTVKLISFGGLLVGAVGIFIGSCTGLLTYSTFLITSSPDATYRVELTGQKERPIWLTVEVRAKAFKNDELLWEDEYLHSGDAFDNSFEGAFPDHRWTTENILQFYRQENFNFGRPHLIMITNDTNRSIKHLKVESEDKFLLFDLQPKSETTLSASPPKSYYPGVRLSGQFYEGRNFKEEAVFNIESLKDSLTCYVHITDDGVVIESAYLRK